MNFCRVALAAGALIFATPVFADDFSQFGMFSDGSRYRQSQQPNRSSLGFLPSRPPISKPVELAQGGAQPDITPQAPSMVALDVDYAPGEVVIDTSGKMLYLMTAEKQAYAYPIAVGKPGFTWTGTEAVSKIVDWPEWLPPDDMRQRMPKLPIKMTGGVKNPLGAKAIYLGNTLYRIHGTNSEDSIGTAASSGCFRMHNEHVVHLASQISPGTVVHVLKSLPAPGSTSDPSTVDQGI